MRFLLGVLLGYTMRGRKRLLIGVITALVILCFWVIPGIALSLLGLEVYREKQSRPPQTAVPSIKGLSYETAEAKLRASNLNIQLLATRGDLQLQPGLIIDQTPQAGEKVEYGHPVGVTVSGDPIPRPK